MRLFFTLFILGSVLLAGGCAGTPVPDDQAAQVAGTPPETTWQYPIAPGIWYPGDGPLPEHPFKYYRLRCWPGCHDPNGAPRPHP